MSQRARQQQQARHRRRAALTRGAAIAIAALVGIAVVVAAGSAIFGDDDGDGPTATPGVVVSMTEFAFSPDPIVVTAGADAQIEVVNDGSVAHDLVITELGKGTADLPPGDRQVLDLSGQPAGTYEVVCDLPGHTEAGMVTELTIE